MSSNVLQTQVAPSNTRKGSRTPAYCLRFARPAEADWRPEARKGQGRKGRNPKARDASHICHVVLLTVRSLSREGRKASPQLSAGDPKCGTHKSCKQQTKSRFRTFKNVPWSIPKAPKSRSNPPKIEPRGSKFESCGLQNTIFRRHLI